MASKARSAGTAGVTVNPSLKRLSGDLARAGMEFDDFRDVWANLTPDIKKEFTRTVQSRGQTIGAVWPPLTKEYAKRKGGGQILRKTGRLLSSVRLLSKAKKAMKFGVKGVEYAHAQWVRRPFLGVTKNMETALNKHAQDFVTSKLNKHGFPVR